MDIEWTALPQATQATIQVSQPVLQLALEGPAEVRFGNPELYRLRVKNPGNAVVKDVEVTLTANLTVATAPTSAISLPWRTTDRSRIDLPTSRTDSDHGACQEYRLGLESSSQIDIQVQKAEMVAQWQGPEKHYQGSLAEYRLRLVNEGTITAENVLCALTIPTSAEVISIPDGARIVGREVQWSVLRMDPGFSQESLFEIRMDQAGEHALQLQVQGSAGPRQLASI